MINDKTFHRKSGFSLLELTITLVVGAILMLGMLPLIRISGDRGAEMQFQMRDLLELQSLVEQIGAYNATTNLSTVKATLGAPGVKNMTSPDLGSFYLHSADYVYFDGSSESVTTNGNTGLLEIRVGLSAGGPSLTKMLNETN